jgi:hypothetical protein
MLSVFNCRDLGVTGIFIRQDYSVSCESSSYQNSVFIAALGTVLYPVGIPILFYLVIRLRDHPLFSVPSLLLYQNFALEWMYYEVYDLVRKLLLTSVMPFISPPDTPSQCLYLLCVDMIALIVLAYSRPYANEYDDLLSGFLIAVECMLFLLALVVVSGISVEDNYNESALYNTTFVMILFTLVCVLPWTLLMKFQYVRNQVNSLLNHIKGFGIVFPDLRRSDTHPSPTLFCNPASDRLDAKWRLTEDASVNDSQLFRPSESVVHDFAKFDNILVESQLSNPPVESPSAALSQSTQDNPTPKSRLLVYKNEDIFNPMKSRLHHQDSRGTNLASGSLGDREASSSSVGAKVATFDITREVDDRESSSSRMSTRAGGGISNTEVHL